MGFFGDLFGNFKLGIQISNQVIKTLLHDKELFVYPLAMALVSFFLLIIIFVPFILFGGLTLGPLSLLLLLIIYYLVTTYISTYFIFALYISFTSFVGGKKIGMLAALSGTAQYTGLIIKWTLFYTVVITIIRLIELRFRGIIGFILREIVALGLFVGMTFAVPIIYEDRVGPIEAVKRSTLFIINNLGKTFAGIIYFDVIGFAIKAVGGILIAAAIVMGVLDIFHIVVMLGSFTILGHTSLTEIAVVFIIGVAIYIVGWLFNYVTLHIYYLVVYDFVKSGKAPAGIDETLIKRSIKRKAGAQGGQGGGSGGGSSRAFGGLFQSGGDNAPDLKTFVK